MGKERSRLLLADDHGLVAAGLREPLGMRYDIVDVVADGQALIDATVMRRPDLILADISMPGLDGLEATRRLRETLPDVPVIFLTMHDDAGHAKAAFEAGAMGYLVKSSAPRELFTAIEEVLAGRLYVTSTIAAKVMGTLRSPEDPSSESGTSEADAQKNASSEHPLTRREIEITGLVGEGLENAEIAERLCIAEVTVRTHYHRVLRKLGLRNRVELARYALDQGWAVLREEAPLT